MSRWSSYRLVIAAAASLALTGGLVQPAIASGGPSERPLLLGRVAGAENEYAASAEGTDDGLSEEQKAAVADAQIAARSSAAPVVVDELTTPTELTTALPNGMLQYEVRTIPVRAEEDGEWKPVDVSLVAEDGWLEPALSAAPVRFTMGGSDELTQVMLPSGEWLSETWPYGDLPAPVVDGKTATYPEVFAGVDLRLTATELGMTSVYVVKTPQAAADERLADLRVNLEGADITQERTGAFTAETDEGVSMTASSPLWWDSSDGGNAEGPGEAALVMPVDHSFDESGITLDVHSTVDDTQPNYPIFIDPDWSTGVNATWYTDANWPNQSYLSASSSDVLRMGKFGNMHGNAFFEFRIGALAGKQIRGAQLAMTQTAVMAEPNLPVQLRTFGIQSAGFTWNQQNHSLWGPVLGTQSPGVWQGPPVAVGWDVKSAIEARVGQDYIQFGLAPENETSQSRRHFSRSATLTVTYNTPPDVPTDPKFVTPSASCGTTSEPRYISATSVTVSVNQTDPDAENVDTNFDLHKTSDLNNRVDTRYPGLGAQGLKQVTFSNLVDGQAYAWRARGSDWKIDGVGYSPWCYFTVDRTPPSAPVITFPAGQRKAGEAVTATFSTKPSDNVQFIAYTVATPANASSFVFDVFNSPPQCGSSIGLVRIVCPDASGAVPATFAPIEATTTLLAISYDKAGNPAVVAGTPSGQAGRVGAKYQFTATNSASASFAAGHVWLTQNKTLPLGQSITDTNTNTPSPLTLGVYTDRNTTANPISPSVPVQKGVLAFWGLASSLSNDQTVSYYLASTPVGPGGQAIYSCKRPRPLVHIYGTRDQCDAASLGLVSLLGYTWSNSRGATPLISCRRPDNPSKPIYAWPNATCEDPGDEFIEQLGYVYAAPRSGPNDSSASNALIVGNSFTAAGWLKPSSATAARTAIKSVSSGDNFELGATTTEWKFCTLSSTGVQIVCVTAPRSQADDWTHVAGVYDSVNGQLRLYLNASLASTVDFRWSAPSTSPVSIVVGPRELVNSSPTSWGGLVADPAVFNGVLTASQIGSLRSGQDPANG